MPSLPAALLYLGVLLAINRVLHRPTGPRTRRSLDGGSSNGHAYPGAVTTVNDWITLDGCSNVADSGVPSIDLGAGIAGSETSVTRYGTSCAPGGHAELWTINGGGHLPSLGAAFAPDVIDFLLTHPKP